MGGDNLPGCQLSSPVSQRATPIFVGRALDTAYRQARMERTEAHVGQTASRPLGSVQ
jgi:hypothetical protein